MKTRIYLLMVCAMIVAILCTFTNLKATEEKALFFDGQNDYLECPFIAFDKMAAFTIEVWVKNWSGYIINQGASGDPENGIWLSTDEGPTDGCAWEVEKGTNYAVNIGTLSLDKWTHIAMQYDGKFQTVFLNGNLVKKQIAPRPGPLDDTRDFIIGGVEMKKPEYYWYYGAGYLRSIRISNTMRYGENFKPEDILTSDSKTILLYNQNSVQKSMLMDLTKNKLSGSIRGVRLLPADEIKATTLSGVVRDPENHLLSNVSVSIKDGEDFGPGTGLETKSNSMGEYKFLINVPAKFYTIYAYKDSLLQALYNVHVDEAEHTKIDFSLKPSVFRQFSWAGRLFGDWLYHQTTPDKQDIKMNFRFDWLYNCNFMKYDWSFQKNGTVLDAENALIGWDPVKRQLCDWRWDLAGDRSEGIIEITTDKIIRKYTLTTPQGEIIKGANLLWFEDINTLYLQYALIDKAGQVQPKGEPFVFKRVIP